MVRPLSMDLRERAVARIAAGESVRKAAPGAERRAVERGEVDAKAAGGGQRRAWQNWRPCAAEDRGRPSGVACRADGGGVHPARTGGRTCRARAAGRLPHRLDIHPPRGPKASKKTVLASEQNRPGVARKRGRWKTRQGRIDPRRLVFIDETWGQDEWGRCAGGSARPAPAGTGSLRTREDHDIPRRPALRPHRCAMVLDGPINGESFRVYVERVVVPALAQGDRCDGQLSAATRARRSAARSAPPGRGYSSCRPPVPISTRSSRCSPS